MTGSAGAWTRRRTAASPATPIAVNALGQRMGPDESVSAIVNLTALSVALCGGGLLLSALVDIADGGADAAVLAAIGVLALVVGVVAHRAAPLPERVPPRSALRMVAAGMTAMIGLSALTYWATGAINQVDDALVESTAGFTTTALTVLDNPGELGAGMLFWRALTQWIGGFSAVATAIAILPFLGVSGPAPTQAKPPSGAKHLFSTHVRRLLRQYLALYLLLTAVGAALYLLAGLSLFDATTYAFTTISTGGFSNYRGSFTHFDSALLEWMGTVGMFLGGLSLALVWCVLRGRSKVLLRSTELFWYCGIIAAATAAIAIAERPGDGFAETLRLSAFTATSAVSSTGHWATNWAQWSPGPQFLLMMLIGLGAMSGSMGGGFRIVRAMALVSFLWGQLLHQLKPRAVHIVRVGHETLSARTANQMLGYQALFVATTALGMLALTLTGADVVTAVSGSISALSTFGPALGELEVGTAISSLDHGALLVVSALMFAGRIELYPVFDGIFSVINWPLKRLSYAIRSRGDRS